MHRLFALRVASRLVGNSYKPQKHLQAARHSSRISPRQFQCQVEQPYLFLLSIGRNEATYSSGREANKGLLGWGRYARGSGKSIVTAQGCARSKSSGSFGSTLSTFGSSGGYEAKPPDGGPCGVGSCNRTQAGRICSVLFLSFVDGKPHGASLTWTTHQLTDHKGRSIPQPMRSFAHAPSVRQRSSVNL